MRRKTLLLVALLAAVAVPAAGAHVTVNPREVPAGSFARFDVRVPNERPNADTVKLTIQIPEGLEFVSFLPKPGWKRTVETEKLDEPVTNDEGETITERIASVTWEGGRIAPGEFDEFGLSAKVPEAAGTELVFPAVQTYSNGEVVRWIGPADADEPASRVTLAPKEGEEPAEPAANPAPTSPEGDADSDADGRANLALGFGIAGLVAGLAGLGASLRRRRA